MLYPIEDGEASPEIAGDSGVWPMRLPRHPLRLTVGTNHGEKFSRAGQEYPEALPQYPTAAAGPQALEILDASKYGFIIVDIFDG